jgi:hypothetical protein
MVGALGLLTKFGVDFYSLRKIVKGQNVANQDDFKFIDSQNRAPFSFQNYCLQFKSVHCYRTSKYYRARKST